SNLVIDGVTIYGLNSGVGPNQAIISIKSVTNSVLSNFNLDTSYLIHSMYGFSNFVYTTDNGLTRPMTLQFTGWTLKSGMISEYTKFFNINFGTFSNIAGINFKDFTVKSYYMSWYVSFIIISVSGPADNTITATPKYINFRNITWDSSTM